MRCEFCGTDNTPGAAYCSGCGKPLVAPNYGGQQSYYPSYNPDYDTQDRGLRLAAFVLADIATVGIGILIIPLAWMIPMTVRAYGIYKGTKPNTVAFGVCSLIFLDLISGILLLISKKDA
jgi:hypothetical protein